MIRAVGRRLAAPAIAITSVPGFRRAAMDGYAVRFSDTRPIAEGHVISLEIVGKSLPGRPCLREIGAGECAAIATGAVVPEGADTIARWEIVDRHDNRILIHKPVEARKDIALPDEDIPAGTVIVAPPRTLRPQDVAACASAGLSELRVVRKPRVGILLTGDELVSPGATSSLGQIVDTNSIVLRHLIERDGGEVVTLADDGGSLVRDDFESIHSALKDLLERVDCLLVSGGTSYGEGDHAIAALLASGNIAFRGVRMRPGAPITFGMAGDVPVVLLPGNPVACRFGYDLLARCIVRAQGARDVAWPYPVRPMQLVRPVRSALGRVDCVRVRLVDEGRVDPVWPRGASILSSTVLADGFVVVPEQVESLEADQTVDVHFYDVQD